MPFIRYLIFLTMEMVNIHADLRHVFKPPESGGTLESSVDREFCVHACSSSCDTLFFFVVPGTIVSFSSCVLKATSQTYDDAKILLFLDALVPRSSPFATGCRSPEPTDGSVLAHNSLVLSIIHGVSARC